MNHHSNDTEFILCKKCTSKLPCMSCKQVLDHNFSCLTIACTKGINLIEKKQECCYICSNFKCMTLNCYNVSAQREDEYVDYCESCLEKKCVTCCFNDRDLTNRYNLCLECFANKCANSECVFNKYISVVSTMPDNMLCYECMIKKNDE